MACVCIQIVRTSRSLALSEAEREAETKVLRDKIEDLKQEATRRVVKRRISGGQGRRNKYHMVDI